MKIILASASPRRRELLGQIGLSFEIKVSNVKEQVTTTEPKCVVEELSQQKAEAVLELMDDAMEAVLVIGADTIVVMNGQILGKPSDQKNAAEMLESLSGKSHEVYTGVTLLYRPGQGDGVRMERKSFHERTRVELFPLTEQEILSYVSSGDCLDKAGAYGIQGYFARYIKGIEGDYNNVVGLPVGRLYQEAKEWIGT